MAQAFNPSSGQLNGTAAIPQPKSVSKMNPVTDHTGSVDKEAILAEVVSESCLPTRDPGPNNVCGYLKLRILVYLRHKEVETGFEQITGDVLEADLWP